MHEPIVNQERYLWAVDRLIEQGGCSFTVYGSGPNTYQSCRYNVPETGRHCFAGWLAPEDLRPHLPEGGFDYAFKQVGLHLTEDNKDMIRAGQYVHDSIASHTSDDSQQLRLLRIWKDCVLKKGWTAVGVEGGVDVVATLERFAG